MKQHLSVDKKDELEIQSWCVRRLRSTVCVDIPCDSDDSGVPAHIFAQGLSVLNSLYSGKSDVGIMMLMSPPSKITKIKRKRARGSNWIRCIISRKGSPVKSMKRLRLRRKELIMGTRCKIIKVAMIVGPIWFVSQYSMSAALARTSVASATIWFSTSVQFTLLIGAALGEDSIDTVKVVSVLVSVGGVTMTALGKTSAKDRSIFAIKHKSTRQKKTMGFFDLNIPYTADKPALVKLVAKTLELGYDGAAYNRIISGVVSDHDRCSIVPIRSLDALLRAAPSLDASASFHRRLLDVPLSTNSTFRQYTRLTVHAENVSHAHALNAGNHIVKSYDLVAVRPLSQAVFDVACEKAEVDIISIDFTEKLSFRIKLPMVKAAIKRGVYFEITYSSLIKDVHVRRQFISSAKLLVEWTRGRNLIISSAASSVNYIRGPFDVANLMSLIGISMEHAKASLSKNCRTLLANTLRKKKFFKEAIRVEKVPAETFGLSDWLNWDPISSGDGDLPLKDLKKLFSVSDSKTTKAIDFSSVIDDLSSHAFLVEDLVSENATVPPLSEEGRSLSDTAVVVGRDVAFKTTLVACSLSKSEATVPSPSNPEESGKAAGSVFLTEEDTELINSPVDSKRHLMGKGYESICDESMLSSENLNSQGDVLLTPGGTASVRALKIGMGSLANVDLSQIGCLVDQMEIDTVNLNPNLPEYVTLADATFPSSNLEELGEATSSTVQIEEGTRLSQSDFDNEQQCKEKSVDFVSNAIVSNSDHLNSGGDMVLSSVEISSQRCPMKLDEPLANPEFPEALTEAETTVPSSYREESGRATSVSCSEIASQDEVLENANRRSSMFCVASSLSEGGLSKNGCFRKLSTKLSAYPELSEEVAEAPLLIDGEVNEGPADLAFPRELSIRDQNHRAGDGHDHKLTANLISQGQVNKRLKRRMCRRPTSIPFKRLMISPVFFKRKGRSHRNG